MVRNEFTFPSADGRTGIHAVEWTPDMAPRAVLVLSHGVSEHILRYEPLAAYLTEWGFAVAGHDHLGHGLSVAAGAPRLYFGPRGSWDWAVQDLYARRELAGQRFPGLPVFLLGHSMGSFLARTYLIRYPGTVAGAILMGTGQMPPALVAAGRVLAAREARKVGDRHSSPLVNKLAFEAYNQKFAPNTRDTTGSPPARRTWTSILRIPSAEGTPPSDSFGRCCGGSPALRSKRT